MTSDATWFASDVHLDANHADIAAAFVAFLGERVTGAGHLFILGDLFESWVGDDDRDESKDRVRAALADLGQAGTRCYFAHGNRDFLVGDDFAAAAGVTLLPEAWVGDFFGTRVLLMHGDTLCTDDREYQAFRKMVREPKWQQEFLALPLAQRQAMAQAARDASRAGMAHKPADIMDVNQQAVIDAMRAHRVSHLIHGHTHRPATHRFDVDGEELTRYVLGDWYEQGRVIYWDAAGPASVTL